MPIFRITCPITVNLVFEVNATTNKLTAMGALKKITEMDISEFFGKVEKAFSAIEMSSLKDVNSAEIERLEIERIG